MAAKRIELNTDMDLIGQFSQALNPTRPWDSIVDFTMHPSFCGYKPYPRQLTLLKLIYLETENMTAYDIDVIEGWRKGFGGKESIGVPPDVWDRVKYLKENGYRRFTHVLSVLGRRASKGWTGGIIGAETLAYMHALDDWQDYYGIQAHKDGYMNCLATNFLQAQKFQFADVREAVRQCRYLQPWIAVDKNDKLAIQTPADKRYQNELLGRKHRLEQEIATLNVVAMTSNSSSGRGATAFANFYDEFAHMVVGTGGPRTSEEVYSAYQPSLMQFGKDQLTYIPSSPYSKVGQFYNLYTQGSAQVTSYREKHGGMLLGEIDEEVDIPTMLVVQLPSWELYRDFDKAQDLIGVTKKSAFVVKDSFEMKLEKKQNPSKFKVEYNAQFAEVEDAYLDSEKVDAIFAPWRGEKLERRPHGFSDRIYHAHADPGRTNANFALAISHLEDAEPVDRNGRPDPNGEVWPHVVVDVLHVWKAEDFPDNTIHYPTVEKEIGEILDKYPSLVDFSFDQWNSAGMMDSLRLKYGDHIRFHELTFTKKENFSRFEKFKSAVNLGWVHSYYDTLFDSDAKVSLLEQELKFLTEKNGEVVKQDFGPVTTKDLSDCVMATAVRLLDQSLSMWRGRMGLDPVTSTLNTTRSVDNITKASSLRDRLDSFGTRGFGADRTGMGPTSSRSSFRR